MLNIGINVVWSVIQILVVLEPVETAVVRVANMPRCLLVRVSATASTCCFSQAVALVDVDVQRCFELHQHLRLNGRWPGQDELHVATQLVFDLLEDEIAEQPVLHIPVIFQRLKVIVQCVSE